MTTPLEQDLLNFLSHKYVARSDERQRQMGLGYITAEVHDLAKEVTNFLGSRLTTASPERNFPVMLTQAAHGRSTEAQLKAACVPVCVIGMPWRLLRPHEKQADRNHGQTLACLAERGGLSSCEMVAVMDDRQHRPMSEVDAQVELLRKLWGLS